MRDLAGKPAFWRSFALFQGLDAAALAALAAGARQQRWQPGEVLFQRGDPGDWMVALAAGRVKLTLLAPAGRELILRHAEPGDTLGEFALVDGEPRSADATAVQATTGFVLDRARFAALAGAHPALGLSVARYFCRRLRETTEQLEGIALYQLEARLARFLLFSLRQLNGPDLPPTAVLRLEISQGELAAVLGASRPKVNRALQALEAAGAILRQDGAWTLDPVALAAAAEPEA
ncbi:Crp/Fnr family transcriptional regulator [Rhodobacter capsulatus]|uniref:Crp/Fnr family transcriptional regulator n=1 Tax=Rhodobacter capsulatus TaxID=1061 RepID=UPI0003D3B133|nr:Crp/Fnr family transcriptional regulator [Rhodobacter capsulatus]ETD85511.1 Crp/Fnr family transcriptional regulator [Rhodobacter capsulatus YW1]